MVKETENFFNGSKQSRFTIYFKIAVYKILKIKLQFIKYLKFNIANKLF